MCKITFEEIMRSRLGFLEKTEKIVRHIRFNLLARRLPTFAHLTMDRI